MYALTPDVPLGPFEGVPVTVWSAQSKQARLHASSSCSFLRSARATRQQVRLDASTVDRMCSQCGSYRSWARPGTGLDIFLEAVSGLGLLYELDSYTEADEDSYSEDDVRRAAALLRSKVHDHQCNTPEQEIEEDEEAEEELSDALNVRRTVLSEWRAAFISLARVHQIAEPFPWLKPWMRERLIPKIDRMENCRIRQSS